MTAALSDGLLGCAVVFEPADPPRAGRLAFWGDDDGLDRAGEGEPGELRVLVPDGEQVAERRVPARRVPVSDAARLLGRARTAPGAHRAAAFWGAAAVVALQLVARGRLLPGVSPGGHDAWRVGPLDAADVERIRALAAAMPPEARATPLATPPHDGANPAGTHYGAKRRGAVADGAEGGAAADGAAGAAADGAAGAAADGAAGAAADGAVGAVAEGAEAGAVAEGAGADGEADGGAGGWEVPEAERLVRAFLDAVADGMPRSPAAAAAAGAPAFAAREPQRVPELRLWAGEVAAGLDAGVRVSLRVEAPRGRVGGGIAADRPFEAVVQVHGLADPTLMADAGELWLGGEERFGPRGRIDAILAVRRAARAWPPLERLLGQSVPDRLTLTDHELGDLLTDAGGRLAAARVAVHWPKQLARELTATATVSGADRPPSDAPSFFGGEGLFRFSWQLALGGEALTEDEMDRLAESQRPVVRLRDQWVLVDPELARRARERELKPLSAIDALGVALTGEAEVEGAPVRVDTGGWLDALRAKLADPDGGDEPLAQPPALAATLRDYQLRGLRWLERMTTLGLGGCLADDMGLGKTITLIALHLHRQRSEETAGPTLVVCPASLLGNWEREVERFAPGTPVQRFHGAARSLDDVPATGFVLTTYGTMRLDAERLREVRWGLVVADEAQHVKNPLSRTAKALRTIPGGARVALTGTPVENTLSELWAVLDWTTPGLLGPLSAFRARWAKPIEADGDTAVAARLATLVRPFLLRRKKSDPGIAPELPPKTETDRPVSLTPEQAGLYEAVVREAMEEIRGSEGMQRRGLVMRMLTSLKQICNHPAQFLKEEHPTLPGRSGKLELLDELLDTILAEDGAVLVFTQYVAMARLVERHLAARGVPSLFLHGGTPVRRREEMVAAFQAGEAPVFLLSLKAAGTGLNLTRADHVVHLDRWWNPAVEEQATDRAYRIGQTRPVQVHRLIAEGTVEDRIAEMLRAKRDLADAVLGTGEGALSELSDADLASLVELRGGR